MRRRRFRPSGNSRPRPTPGDSTLMPRVEHDGDKIVDSKAIRYFKADLSQLTGTSPARIRKSVLEHEAVYNTEVRGPILYIKLLVSDNDVQEDASAATAALKTALGSLGILVRS